MYNILTYNRNTRPQAFVFIEPAYLSPPEMWQCASKLTSLHEKQRIGKTASLQQAVHKTHARRRKALWQTTKHLIASDRT